MDTFNRSPRTMMERKSDAKLISLNSAAMKIVAKKPITVDNIDDGVVVCHSKDDMEYNDAVG